MERLSEELYNENEAMRQIGRQSIYPLLRGGVNRIGEILEAYDCHGVNSDGYNRELLMDIYLLGYSDRATGRYGAPTKEE